MFKQLRHWLENKRIKKMGLTTEQWESAIADWPVMQRYQGAERAALQDMAFRLMVRKRFVSGDHFQFTQEMCLKVATMASVPILHLGLAWYDHWYTIILYEGDFIPNRPYRSDDGVVHAQGPGLSGEAWLRGPVILSWASVCETGAHARHTKASNVVIHELAHKLDMLRDGANGAPPMHPDMRPGEWHDIFTAAWDRLQHDLQRHRPLPLDDYALTNPAEFFAVCSETFFEDAQQMKQKMPEVYRLLCQFYRQQPA
ncbi:zinc-dependent peptidase [Amphritea sp. 2_MG-2023]|uniref:M90 family metallopeptidase n=1 Tax=Amphritea TaxID=515417 RepID=UPI001C06A275|nr:MULTISPECIES: M90 family metallopeptidase [Amphritea]MBU2966041.1 zinc-dependent peptidase [Amphritea atlantica]MDO6418131.1 zinc-dependent peptidase [Amphritea sp. 2_MG-2023]